MDRERKPIEWYDANLLWVKLMQRNAAKQKASKKA